MCPALVAVSNPEARANKGMSTADVNEEAQLMDEGCGLRGCKRSIHSVKVDSLEFESADVGFWLGFARRFDARV